MDDEQERIVKKPQKAPKTPEFDTDLDDLDDEQEPIVKIIKNLQKASTITKFVDTGPSAEDEQKPVVKKLQKASKIHDEDPQEISPVHKESARPAKKLPAASCTHILTSGISKGNQCWFKASDKTGKFCHHHKQT